MAGFMKETVTSVKHWNDTLFSFTTSRDPAFRFKNGHFIMMGLEHEGKPLMRAYSIAHLPRSYKKYRLVIKSC